MVGDAASSSFMRRENGRKCADSIFPFLLHSGLFTVICGIEEEVVTLIRVMADVSLLVLNLKLFLEVRVCVVSVEDVVLREEDRVKHH